MIIVLCLTFASLILDGNFTINSKDNYFNSYH